jgi:alkylation response protein AidB-like acyl-CoA dehydrogenase
MVMCKYVATNNAVRAVDQCMEAVGAHGMLKKFPMERYFRDVRAGVNHPMSNARARELIGKTALGIGLGETPRW